MRLACTIPALGAAALATTLMLGTAHAAPGGPPPASPASGGAGNHLVVLGDSWAAGSAAGDVDRVTGACRRSAHAYAPQVAAGLGQPRWVSRACTTGPAPATSTTAPTRPAQKPAKPAKPSQEPSPATAVPSRPGTGLGSTLGDALGGVLAAPLSTDGGDGSDGGRADDQFAVVDTHTRAIVATVGGDAVGLGALARACSTAGTVGGCDDAAGRTERSLAALPKTLDASLAALHRRAPDAVIVLSGYPHLSEGVACGKGAADLARAARMDTLVDRLDSVLSARAGAAHARFVDVRPAFRGHGVCAPASWLTPLNGADAVLAGGPTALGQQHGYTGAVLAAVTQAAPKPKPKPTPTPTPTPTPAGGLFTG